MTLSPSLPESEEMDVVQNAVRVARLATGQSVKLRILSDVHLEFGKLRTKQGDEDMVILAGDIGVGCEGFPWARKTFPDKQIVYVAGNHEFYGGRILSDHYRAMKASAEKHRVQFLQDDMFIAFGTRFIGATLWTDFDLFGNAPTDALAAARAMNDFSQIKTADERWDASLTTDEWLEMHKHSRAFIERALRAPFDGPTVVVTHHAPSGVSVPSHYKSDRISACYASRLESLMLDYAPALWVHGHIHESLDYMIGETRVVTNPRGYAGHELNPHFDAEFAVEVTAAALPVVGAAQSE